MAAIQNENFMTYLNRRKSDPALKWLYERLNIIGSKFKRGQFHGPKVTRVQNGIIYLGLLDPAIQNGIRNGIGHGGPLGELVQWADLIGGLNSVYDLIGSFKIIISLD